MFIYNQLKEKIGIKKCIKDYGVDEKVFLEKLDEMKESGKNPFEITKFDRTHLSSEIIANADALENTTVRIAGESAAFQIVMTQMQYDLFEHP